MKTGVEFSLSFDGMQMKRQKKRTRIQITAEIFSNLILHPLLFALFFYVAPSTYKDANRSTYWITPEVPHIKFHIRTRWEE